MIEVADWATRYPRNSRAQNLLYQNLRLALLGSLINQSVGLPTKVGPVLCPIGGLINREVIEFDQLLIPLKVGASPLRPFKMRSILYSHKKFSNQICL